MEFKNSGEMIAEARRNKGYTQKQVAEILGVSDKAVSKWETGGGSPDIRILADLAKTLGIDEKALLLGIVKTKERDNGNLKKTSFYVCPSCGNVFTSTSGADISCCGIKLNALKIDVNDESHSIHIEPVDDENYVTIDNHPMSKEHYISFMCFVTGDKMFFTKLYPEQAPEARFPRRGHGFIYAYCNNHGLYKKMI